MFSSLPRSCNPQRPGQNGSGRDRVNLTGQDSVNTGRQRERDRTVQGEDRATEHRTGLIQGGQSRVGRGRVRTGRAEQERTGQSQDRTG